MNDDILQARWKQAKGQIRTWWGKLTDDDVDQIAGRMGRLIGLLQERYGYTRQRAEEEVARRLGEFEAQVSDVMPK